MDLRGRLAPGQVDEACTVLNYQPFLITDDIQTGAAYSWMYLSDPRVAPPLVFRRSECDPGKWNDVNNANRRLARMYDDLLGQIASYFPGGSLFDFGCNNGYFPVRAQTMGMGRCLGMDAGDYGPSVRFLNKVMGTTAEFRHASYDSVTHTAPITEKFDVATLSAALLHNPDPLHLLAWLGSIATKAIFFLGQIVESEALIIAYRKPHPSLGVARPFPHYFNDETRLSRGLLWYSLSALGYTKIAEVPWQTDWVPDGTPTISETHHPEGGYTKSIAVLAMK
jgi:hypothetical protein